MTTVRLLTVGAIALLLAACQPSGTAGKGKDPGAEPVATVGGKPITTRTFEAFVKAATGREASELSPENRKEAIEALASMQVLAAEAQKQGLDKQGEAAANLELARLNILQRAISDNYLKDKKPTDQELRAEYDALVSNMARSEYRARHILLQNEGFANEILERLKKGEKFETLAKQSLDPSGANGGDLGWSPPDRFVKPFADAMVTLKKGETTGKPVRTQFGFHIIRLDDVRDRPPPPPFEQVKEQLVPAVQAKKLETYTDELMKAAKVEIKDKAATPAAAPAAPAAAAKDDKKG